LAWGGQYSEREFCIDELVVRIHLIIVMMRWTGLASWKFGIPYPDVVDRSIEMFEVLIVLRHAYAHTHIRTYIHTQIHTRTNTHVPRYRRQKHRSVRGPGSWPGATAAR